MIAQDLVVDSKFLKKPALKNKTLGNEKFKIMMKIQKTMKKIKI